MQFARQVIVEAPRQAVWELFWDVPRMVTCVPGCTEANVVEPYQRYQAMVREKVGPFQVKIPLRIDILEHTAPERLVARAGGKDGVVQSHVKIDLDVVLIEVTPQRTEVQLHTDVVVRGKLGTLGHSLIVRKGEEIVGQFATALQIEIEKGKD